MPVNELHQSHYLGERLFDSSQELKRGLGICSAFKGRCPPDKSTERYMCRERSWGDCRRVDVIRIEECVSQNSLKPTRRPCCVRQLRLFEVCLSLSGLQCREMPCPGMRPSISPTLLM